MNTQFAYFFAAIGVACIYAGYRLFCGLPALRTAPADPASVVLRNMLPGALLAVTGAALLTVQAQAVLGAHTGPRRHTPPVEGTSWHRPGPHFVERAG